MTSADRQKYLDGPLQEVTDARRAVCDAIVALDRLHVAGWNQVPECEDLSRARRLIDSVAERIKVVALKGPDALPKPDPADLVK